jgi:hypothetical protein
MKYYTFYRESNNFDDIEQDPIIKKYADTKIRWWQHFMIGINKSIKDSDQHYSLLTLKYGEDMVNSVCKDYSPVAGVDYIPKKDKNNYKVVSSD